MIEGDCGNKVMTDVSPDYVVEKMRVDEAEIAVNGGGCAAGKGPGAVVIMRK